MSVSDVVRRGTSNVLANWPTVAIQVIVAYLSGILLITSGEPMAEVATPAKTAPGAVPVGAILGDWLPAGGLGWVLLFILVAVVLFATLMLHSFITAGNAFIYIGGERAARVARAIPSEVSAYRVFDMRRWLEGAKSSVWRVAGIYCAVAAIVILGAGLLFAINAGLHKMSGALTCGGGVLAALLVLAVGFSFMICLPKAIVICVGRSLSSRESLRLAWGEALDDIGDHVWPVIAAGFIAAIVGTGITGLRSLLEATAPRWLETPVMSFVEQGIAVVGACWFLAMITAVTDVTPDVDS